MYKRIRGIFFLSMILTMILAGCAGKTGTKGAGDNGKLGIEDFYLQSQEGMADPEGSAFLQEQVRELFDVEITAAENDKQPEHSIYLVADEVYGALLGYNLPQMQDGTFVIYNKEDSVYIISKDTNSLKRGVSYFLEEYLAGDGELLLKDQEEYIDLGKSLRKAIYVGERPISEYVIAYAKDEAVDACRELRYYIQQTTGDYLDIVPTRKASGNSISLLLDKKMEKGSRQLEITDGQIYIRAADEDALLDGVYLLADTYLGWMKAGEADARISSQSSVIHVPETVTQQEAWIEEREPIICLWNVNYTRGATLDSDISLKNNIIDFTEEQIYEYVKMMKACGFTGIQVTEMCSTWAGVGDYENAHEKIRMMAEAAHSLDMKFTLWVWGSEFADCGWVDTSVTYTFGEYDLACENPEVVETFEKYYSIYAELADCCDRVIGHYYDPGNLSTAEDIAFFASMLKEKFQAANPDIDFGISCWVDVYDKNVFIDALGTDVTLYESGHHDKENDYVVFRQQIADLGCRMGTWAWNTCEMEIDQLAQMNFNMEVIREVYQIARKYDGIAKPDYWSEMDSYHVLNVFSLYCAAQMLIDPDIPSEELFEMVSEAAVGEEYAAEFAEVLSIIQDARSGYSWDTYFWSRENYVLKSDDYPAEQILERCSHAIPVMEEMIEKGVESNTLPLPISLSDLLQMILPHLKQIQSFAEFRIALAQLDADYEKGVSLEELAVRLEEIADPIKDYNCIIGAWGQIEARAQYEMVSAFSQRTGVKLPELTAFHENRKNYIQNQLIAYQKDDASRPYILTAPYYQLGLAYGLDETYRLVEELVQEGIFVRNEDGSVYLADWENYIYHFD